jgi:hypothetical protein
MDYSKRKFTNFYQFLFEVIKDNNLINLKDINFFCCVFNYQIDKNASFLMLTDEEVQLLNEKRAYVIFDASAEGYSTIKSEHRFFDILYQDSVKYKICPSRIIFTSSNHKDYENFIEWKKNKNVTEDIKIIVWNRFEDYRLDKIQKNIHKNITDDPSEALNINKAMSENLYGNKFFCSLSRNTREWRTLGSYIHSTSEYAKYGMISQSPHKYFFEFSKKFKKFDEKSVKKWMKSLPLEADKDEKEKNWTKWASGSYGTLLNKSLFHLANETYQDDYEGTSLFYTEKTFKPITIFQPFLIYGQQYCNEYLENFGYKLCTNWFNFSFDKEKDILTRLEKISDEVRRVCYLLENMSRKEQIQWRFKDEEVLLHNYITYQKNQFNKSTFLKFLSSL